MTDAIYAAIATAAFGFVVVIIAWIIAIVLEQRKRKALRLIRLRIRKMSTVRLRKALGNRDKAYPYDEWYELVSRATKRGL